MVISPKVGAVVTAQLWEKALSCKQCAIFSSRSSCPESHRCMGKYHQQSPPTIPMQAMVNAFAFQYSIDGKTAGRRIKSNKPATNMLLGVCGISFLDCCSEIRLPEGGPGEKTTNERGGGTCGDGGGWGELQNKQAAIRFHQQTTYLQVGHVTKQCTICSFACSTRATLLKHHCVVVVCFVQTTPIANENTLLRLVHDAKTNNSKAKLQQSFI